MAILDLLRGLHGVSPAVRNFIIHSIPPVFGDQGVGNRFRDHLRDRKKVSVFLSFFEPKLT